jgi:hypothetical protein
MYKIVFKNQGKVIQEWKGYYSYSEAREALRDADLCFPFYWSIEICEE